MKRVLACIMALALLLSGIAVFAEGADTVTLTYWLPCNDLEGGAAAQSGMVSAAAALGRTPPNTRLDRMFGWVAISFAAAITMPL